MHKITVFLPTTTLTYHVHTFKQTEGRIQFTDRKTGLLKDYPEGMCGIEEVND